MSFPQVSILIPVYNRKKYIAQCIQSALDQTFTDHEIVVVDNASDDGTWEICQQFASRDPRVRVFRNEENIGPVRNWIRCAQETLGEYVKILFSDDLLEPNCLKEMTHELSDPTVGFVFCAARIGSSVANSKLHYYAKSSARLSQSDYLKLLLKCKAPYSPGAVLFRTRDLIKNLHSDFQTATPRPFVNHGAGPDVMISLLTMLDYPFVYRLNKPLVFFRAHEDSFSISNKNNQITEGYTSAIAYFLKKYCEWWIWINYVVCAWFDRCYSNRKLFNPKTHLETYEGVGSEIELFVGSLLTLNYGAGVLCGKVYRRLITAFKPIN